MEKIKIVNYPAWKFRCKLTYCTLSIEAVFQARVKYLWGLFCPWEDIPRRAYIFRISTEEEPKDGRPRLDTNTLIGYYRVWEERHCYKNFNLLKTIAEIADEIVDDIKDNDKTIRLVKEKFKSL